LRRARVPADEAVKRYLKQLRQRCLLKLPDVPARYLVWYREIIDLGQDRAGVNPLGHAVHGEP
jgi:hypothetical protein